MACLLFMITLYSISLHPFGGGWLPIRLSCKHATPWWASAHLALSRSQMSGTVVLCPPIQAKKYMR